MDCPLPIDWLDYLEGRVTDAPIDLDYPLADCRRCQALVDELRALSVGVSLAPYGGRAEAPRWQAEERDEVAVGDVWLTEPVEAIDERQLVVIVDQRDEFDQSWYSVVPLTTETDVATDSDLLLTSEDTSLGVPLAAQFRLQTPLAREQLDAYIGKATDDALLNRALAGELGDDRFGAPVTRGGDSRMRRIESTRAAMAALAVAYGDALTKAEEAAEVADAAAEDPIEPETHLADVVALPAAGWPTAIELKRVHRSLARRTFALAAEKARPKDRSVVEFAIDDERVTFRVQLVLENPLHPENETLLLVVESFAAEWEPTNIVIVVPQPGGERLTTPPFDPSRTKEVVVKRGGVGLVPTKVEQLEVLLGA